MSKYLQVIAIVLASGSLLASQADLSMNEKHLDKDDLVVLYQGRKDISCVTHLDLRTADFHQDEQMWDAIAHMPLFHLREIDVSGNYGSIKTGVDEFLRKLSANKTLVSLCKIDASSSDVNYETLQNLRQMHFEKDHSFVRNMQTMSGRYGCLLAPISVNIMDTELRKKRSIDELIRLESPSEDNRDITYRAYPEFREQARLAILLDR